MKSSKNQTKLHPKNEKTKTNKNNKIMKKNPVAVEKEEERERKSISVLLSFTKSPEEPGLAGCEAVIRRYHARN